MGVDWFILRIGQRVYRRQSSCPCMLCESWFEYGILIRDKKHAEHLCDTQDMLKYKYYDTKEERDNAN